MAKAVEFIKVSKYYKNAVEPAVKDITLTIEEGDIVTILGTSGCGKTTLLKMVNRLYEPTEGDILFFGNNIRNMKPTTLRRQIGYVIQQVGLFPHMTLEENISTLPKMLKIPKEDIKRTCHELLNMVGLDAEKFKDRYPHQLSGGQQQRVGLARALAGNPPLLLLDEPFGALDAITRRYLQDELLRIQKISNKTMLFVTHDINEAFRLGNKVIIMDKGVVMQYGTSKEVREHPKEGFVKDLIDSHKKQVKEWEEMELGND